MNTCVTPQDYYILYVDDEEKSLKYFSRYFSKDYKILTAISTAEARGILDAKAAEIGVLISDQRMPVEKGVELLKYARQNYPHIVRLLTTAYSDLNDAIEAVNRGEILRYIPKPWDINFLELEIRQALRYFLLHQERESLRKEKLNVIQRVLCYNRAKDLIILSAGITQFRNVLPAIRACLLQLPNHSKAPPVDLRGYDVQQLLKPQIKTMLDLTSYIRQVSNGTDCLSFVPFDILNQLKSLFATHAETVKISPLTHDTTIEANPTLIEKLLRLVLEQLARRSETDTDGRVITLSKVNTELQIAVTSSYSLQDISLLDIPGWLLCIYYIGYHHGGSVQVELTAKGSDWRVRLPYRQGDAAVAELPSAWLDEILQRHEILSS